MVKLGLWLGAPALVTFLASSSSVRLENAIFVFAFSVLGLLVGIGPRLTGKNGHQGR